jgi:hypothetical protein
MSVLHLQPIPDPVQEIAAQISDVILTAQWDNAERAHLARLLVRLVSEGCRRVDAA